MQRQAATFLRLFLLGLVFLGLLWLLAGCISTNAPAIQSVAAANLAELAQAPARQAIEDNLFYFVMPDRFANGSSANDKGGLTGDRLTTGFDPTDKAFYHGGDIAGLTAKLDYLEQMGITAIWMTPLFKNKTVQGNSAAYHGYWITDFTQLDPHFGTNEELQTLIQQAHARGIKVFFDIIANHTADVIQYQGGQTTYRSKAEYPYRDANGTPFDDRDYAGTNIFPTLSITQSFPYTPVVPAGEATIKVPVWLNSPLYYHNRGDSQFTGENSLYGDFSELDDLFTEEPQVVQGMIDVYKSWIDNYDIDGFRVDTVKHVNTEFWRAFDAAILAEAKAKGKPDFFVFGEVFSGDERLMSYYTTADDMPAVLDFGLQGALRSYVSQGNSAGGLRAFFATDDLFTDENSNAYELPSFTGNHDMGRFGYFLHQDHGGLSDAEMLAREKLAYAIIFFARGVPIIYYGDEQGFTGDGGDQDARQDMFASQVASYNDDDLIGTDATTAADNFNTSHPLYQAFSQYAALRRAHPALQTGAQIDRFAADGPGIYAFSRIDSQEQVEYLVAFNNSAAASADVQTFYGSGSTFNCLYSEGDVPPTLTTDAKGQLSLTVPAMGFVVYQAAQPVPKSNAAPAITITSPSAHQQVSRGFDEIDGNQIPQRIEIDALITSSQPAPQNAEVTFSVRKTGTTTYTLIGVDDNPPYRVFYDGSIWPDGTQLDFIAVVNDLNGHYNSAETDGVTPLYQRPTKVDMAERYAVVHYLRKDSDYGDPASGNAHDNWGLHLWGDGLAAGEATDWTAPKAFLGEDSYGRFAWAQLSDAGKNIGFIVHKGDTKDGTDQDRFFNPSQEGQEIWLKQGDPTIYHSQAAAQGFVTIHYQRPDGNYTGWGLHLWGDGLASGVATTWEKPRPADGMDRFGLYWQVPITSAAQAVNFIVHNGEQKDPGPDQSLIPQAGANVWIKSGDATLYPQLCAADSTAIIHYHRPAGDYGDASSANFADYWGLHAWNAAKDPGWKTPYKPTATDLFGLIFRLEVDHSQELGYILHRGDNKDPGPDQFLNFAKSGCEVWQAQGADVAAPYILPSPNKQQP